MGKRLSVTLVPQSPERPVCEPGELVDLLRRAKPLAKPNGQSFYGHFAFRHRHRRLDQLVRRRQTLVTVRLDEDDRGKRRNSLAAVDERMVQCKGVHERSGLVRDVRVQVLSVKGRRWPRQSALESSAIAQASRSPVSLQLSVVKSQDLADGQVFDGHFASAWKALSYLASTFCARSVNRFVTFPPSM